MVYWVMHLLWNFTSAFTPTKYILKNTGRCGHNYTSSYVTVCNDMQRLLISIKTHYVEKILQGTTQQDYILAKIFSVHFSSSPCSLTFLLAVQAEWLDSPSHFGCTSSLHSFVLSLESQVFFTLKNIIPSISVLGPEKQSLLSEIIPLLLAVSEGSWQPGSGKPLRELDFLRSFPLLQTGETLHWICWGKWEKNQAPHSLFSTDHPPSIMSWKYHYRKH